MNTPRVLSTNRIGPHCKEILDILIGSLLGDGSMEKDGNAYRFAFYQEKPNGEYLLWLYSQICELGYCKIDIPQIRARKGENDKVRYGYRFRTFTYSSFYWIYEGFYEIDGQAKRRKIIPSWIGDYLTPQVLAIWLMDDGTYHQNRGVRFCTNGFTLNEVKFLGSLLESKFNFTYSYHKTGIVNQYGLYLPKSNLDILIPLVKPHMHPTMFYKLGL